MEIHESLEFLVEEEEQKERNNLYFADYSSTADYENESRIIIDFK